MAIAEVKEQVFADNSEWRITINNQGKVLARMNAASYHPVQITPEKMVSFTGTVQKAFDYKNKIESAKKDFSRDEQAMFDLLSDWQQWAFLHMRHAELTNA